MMTEKELERIMDGNEVKHSLTKIYNFRKLFFYNSVNLPVKISNISNSSEYYNLYSQKAISDYEKSNPDKYIIAGDNQSKSKRREKYLRHFDEKDREIIGSYWDGTIGYATKLLNEKYNQLLDKYIETRSELDKVMYRCCSMPTMYFAEQYSKKIREDLKSKYGDVIVGDYKWIKALPGAVRNISKDGKDYLVVIADFPQNGDYLEMALAGNNACQFIGNSEGCINPFTYEQIVNKDLGYNENLLKQFNIKNRNDLLKLEVFAEFVNENFHEVPFAKFVHLANGIEELVEGYKQVEKIFFEDLNKLESEKMIKKQRKFLKIAGNNAQELIDENISEFQDYFNSLIYDIFDNFQYQAQKYFSKAETPFPEFD